MAEKRTLWGFGDSFSIPFDSPYRDSQDWLTQYSNWKGYFPKISGQVIAEELGCNYIHGSGEQPFDNDSIIESVSHNLKNFKEGDILFIGIAPLTRLRYVENDSWSIYNLYNDTEFDSEYRGILKLSLSRQHILYLKWIQAQCNLITEACKQCEVFFWHWGCENASDTEGYERIIDETDGLIDDFHWSEKGHYDFAQKFLQQYREGVVDNLFERENLDCILY